MGNPWGLEGGEKSRAVFWGACRGSAKVRGSYRKIKLDLESPERDLRVFLPSGSEGLKVRVAKEIVFLVSPSGSWVEGEPTRMRGLFQPFSFE